MEIEAIKISYSYNGKVSENNEVFVNGISWFLGNRTKSHASYFLAFAVSQAKISPISKSDSYVSKPISPWQNGRHVTEDIFKYIFMNGKFCILIRISLKFVPNGPIDNKSALVQVIARQRTGNKALPESMLTQFDDA